MNKSLLIVGLGNPGSKYQHTRHNVGFMTLDILSHKWQVNFQHKNGYCLAKIKLTNKLIFLLKPMDYMNNSGIAVEYIANYYKIPLTNITVIYDDIDIDFGKIKFKTGGGAGGHNGIKNIDKYIGKDYHRLRIGISRPMHKELVEQYVLTNFTSEEKVILANNLAKINDHINLLLDNQSNVFLQKLH